MKKKKTVSLISFIVFVLLFAVLAIFVVPRKKYTFPLYENKLNIAIVGDSLFCNENGERNLAEILESKLDCEMLNCSIGGTCASKLNDGGEPDYYSDKLCFYNISNIICTGNKASVSDNVRRLSAAINDGFQKAKLLAGTNFDKEEILIVNYGVNDAHLRVPAVSNVKYDEFTYAGAIRCGIERIVHEYPDLKIILPEVTYSTLIYYGERDDYFDQVTEEYRTAYNAELKKLADEYENVYYFDFSESNEINKDNYDQYLSDGIHLNDAGKEVYASALADFIGEIN